MLKKISFALLLTSIAIGKEYEYSIGMGKYTNKIAGYNIINLKLGEYLKNRDLLKISLEQSLPIKINNKNNYLTKLQILYNKQLTPKNSFYPYIIGGVGGAYSTSDELKSTGLITLGIGTKYIQDPKTPNNLFIELQINEDFINSSLHIGVVFGIDYKFYTKSSQPPQYYKTNTAITTKKYTSYPKPQQTNIKDFDKDGVPNYLDECPNTPYNVTVNEFGCPLDSDRDGIADYLDKCPFTPPNLPVNQYGCAVDSDRDGVVDTLDKCPNTKRGVKVDKDGCPKFRVNKYATPINTKKFDTTADMDIELPKDSDDDGVIDTLDKCPNTPIGVVVDSKGCPIRNIDSDGDGVPDIKDKCPNTLPGGKVDKNGCMYEFDFKIKFRKNSTKVDPIYYPRIKMFAEFLKSHPRYSAEIQGYTDSKGPARYNKILSEKRAKAVYELLIKFGVNPERLSYFGYGEENPLYPNGKYGNPKNRRVIAKIYKN